MSAVPIQSGGKIVVAGWASGGNDDFPLAARPIPPGTTNESSPPLAFICRRATIRHDQGFAARDLQVEAGIEVYATHAAPHRHVRSPSVEREKKDGKLGAPHRQHQL